jgi:NADH dehydrogenase
MDAAQPRVVIVGGGFAGLYVAKGLAKAPVRITLVDRKNHHTFQPLLYQVATAALNTADIASPLRRILRHQANTEVVLATVERVDPTAKRLLFTDGGALDYDVLVLAAGATHSYFGHDEWERTAPGLKTLEDALEIRKRMLYAFEAAERETDAAVQRTWLNFVIVGAGPTGAELAGALAEIAHHTLEQDFRHFDPATTRVLLLEGGPRVLPTYPPELSAKAVAQLERLGVEVRTHAQVTGIDDRGVNIGAERLDARTVVWAAGVAASPVGASLGVPLDRAGRVRVNPDLTAGDHDDLYVIGDLAAAVGPDGKPVPGVAPAAIQEGRHTAKNILRTLQGRPTEPFRYIDKGSLATIGRAAAIADLGRLKLSGFSAWFAWLTIHIFFLIGFRNRLIVVFEWALSYLTHERAARLITGRLPYRTEFELESTRSRSVEPNRASDTVDARAAE